MATFNYPHKFVNGVAPTEADEVDANFAVVKDFATQQLVHRDGATPMLAPLALSGVPTQPNHVVSKGYVNDRQRRFLECANVATPGGGLSGGQLAVLVENPGWTAPASSSGIVYVCGVCYVRCMTKDAPGAPAAGMTIDKWNATTLVWDEVAENRRSMMTAGQESGLAQTAVVSYTPGEIIKTRMKIHNIHGGMTINWSNDSRFTRLTHLLVPTL